MMDVAYCVNHSALVGLGTTVSSLIRNCSDSSNLFIWFLVSGLSEKDKKNISQLLSNEKFKGKYEIVEFDPMTEFGELRSLHGDWTTYGKLLIPEIVNAERVLYLDADLVIEIDVLDLSNFDFHGCAIAAKYGSQIKFVLDGPFLINKLGMPSESDYFNAGVLLLDLHMWRTQKYKESCLNIARKYPLEIRSHDQTLFNAVFSKSFARLPENYNCAWNANVLKPIIAEKMIIHYVGSPKPWDIGGKIIHSGYKTWKKYLDKDWSNSYYRLTFNKMARAWEIRRSYIRWMLNKVKGNIKTIL